MLKNKTIMIISGVLSAALLAVWTFMLSGEDAPRVWRGLLINYLFFTSLAAGMVVWPAIVVASHGEWMRPVEYICRTGIVFALPSMIALTVLWAGSRTWAPWLDAPPDKLWWLNNSALFLRNLIAQLIFWLIAIWFMANSKTETKRIAAGWLILVYAITFSLTGFDFVMALEPEWHSMMIGGYYFVSGLYLAAAAWILLAIALGSPEKKVLHDMGKLLIAFCMVTTYLMFSHLLPIWYENVPGETIFLIPRINLAWKGVSNALLLMVYIGPVLLLLPAWTKQNRKFLAMVSVMVLAGMWIERWWLVSAVFEKKQVQFGWSELLPALAFLGLFTSGVTFSLRKRSKNMIQVSDT